MYKFSRYLTAATAVAMVLVVFAPLAQAQVTYPFDLPAQPLAESLRAVGYQTSTNVIFEPRLVKEVRAPALREEATVAEAIGRLLAGTELRAVQLTAESILIEEGRKGGDGVRVGEGASAAQAEGGKEGQEGASKLEEIVVSAQKRLERLQDVPLPVSEIRADTLLRTNNTRIEDFFVQVPSLSFFTNPYGDPIISIRGVTTGSITDQPTTAALIDNVPYTASSTVNNTGSVNPLDIDPNDVAHIEVLRGPQGTLYGATAMGGLLKYVTIAPSVDGLSGRVQLGTNTYDGGGVGYTARGAVNLPLSNEAAVRLSGFQVLDPGYIDAHLSNGSLDKDFNDRRTEGGRLAALWKPSDSFSVVVSALYQKDNSAAPADSTVGLPPYQVNAMVGTGPTERAAQFYTAVISAAAGGFDITSTTGYLKSNFRSILDLSSAYGFLATAVYGADITGLSNHINSDFSKVTEELRASRSITRWFDWQIGGFYDHETTSFLSFNPAANYSTGGVVGTLIHGIGGQLYDEYALYSTGTIKFTDRFDVEIGGRESWISNTTKTQIVIGDLFAAFGVPVPLISPRDEFTDTAFTYSFTPRFKISPDTMVYARVASGYRTGSSNGVNAGIEHIPPEYKPDTLIDYEVGTKSTLLDGRLYLDGSIYYIDWRDLQTSVGNTAFPYTANIGSAKSEGVDLSLTAKPARGMAIQGWVSWNDAVLTSELPAGAVGRKGDWLPLARRISSHFSVDQEFPLTSQVTGSAALSWSYLGKSYGSFTSSSTGGFFGGPPSPRQTYPGFSRYDFLVGVQYQKYRVDAYVNNLTNKAGLIGGGEVGGGTINEYIKPREFGLQLTVSF